MNFCTRSSPSPCSMRHAAADDGSQAVAASRPADGTAPRPAGRPAETPFPSGVTTQRNSMFVVLVTTNELMLDLYSLEASGQGPSTFTILIDHRLHMSDSHTHCHGPYVLDGCNYSLIIFKVKSSQIILTKLIKTILLPSIYDFRNIYYINIHVC